MWELVAAGLEARAAATAGEVLLMRADILLDILGGRIRLMGRAGQTAGQTTGATPANAGGGGGGGGGTRHTIKGMDDLRRFLGGKR